MSVTIGIIALTSLISLLSFSNNALKEQLIFSPYSHLNEKKWWLVITHGFIHADYLHLIFNMYVLYIFGGNVERFFLQTSKVAYLYFILLYIGGMIFATLPSLIKHRNNSNYKSLGASGAVAAIVFVFIALSPISKMGLIILPGIYIPAFIFGVLYLIAENYMSRKGTTNIAHDAHIAGAIFGLVFLGGYDYKLYIKFFDTIINYIGIG